MLINGSGLFKRWIWLSGMSATVLIAGCCFFTKDNVAMGWVAEPDNDLSDVQVLPDNKESLTTEVEKNNFQLPEISDSLKEVSSEQNEQTEQTSETPEVPQTVEAPKAEIESLKAEDGPQLGVGALVAAIPDLPRNSAFMEAILRILINDGVLSQYMQHWYQAMDNDDIRYISTMQNNRNPKFYLFMAQKESVQHKIQFNYENDLLINYQTLNIPGSLSSGYVNEVYSHNLHIKDTDVSLIQDRQRIYMQMIGSWKDNWQMLLGAQLDMSKKSFTNGNTNVVLDQNSNGAGLDVLFKFQVPDKPFFMFSRGNIGMQRQRVQASQVFADTDTDKYSFYRSYFTSMNFGIGYNINVGKSQQIITTMSIGAAMFRNNEYVNYWDKIYNIGIFGASNIHDLLRKDWQVKVKSSGFTYLPINMAFQWKNHRYWLSTDKKLVGISPQLTLGVSWNAYKNEKNDYNIELTGKWSDLDRFANEYGSGLYRSLYKEITAKVKQGIPKTSRWMLHAEMSLHFSTETIPSSKLSVILSMNDEITRYLLEMVMNFEI